MTDVVIDTPAVLFDRIANDIYIQGYSILTNAFPAADTQRLLDHVQSLGDNAFHIAGTGRQQEHQLNAKIRRDKIHWLSPTQPVENSWLSYMADLQQYLNRRLFLGLFSYESHFSHYEPGDFYRKHMDAFRGQANRILTTVLYLNPDWQPSDQGELIIFHPDHPDKELLRVAPKAGTLVTFLSEEFPHEVVPCQNHRFSIAGWFRLNSSNANRADPPR